VAVLQPPYDTMLSANPPPLAASAGCPTPTQSPRSRLGSAGAAPCGVSLLGPVQVALRHFCGDIFRKRPVFVPWIRA
jgi:hypothetical protein